MHDDIVGYRFLTRLAPFARAGLTYYCFIFTGKASQLFFVADVVS